MYSKYPFTLDIHASMSQVSIPVTVGDTARRLYIGLTDGGEPFIIPDGYRAVLTAEKADGTHLLNDCIIEQSGAVIRYDFTEQTASAVGRVCCQVKLYGANGEVLAEPRFTIVVYEGYADDDIISEDEKTTIDAIIIAEQKRVEAEAYREEVTQRADAAANRATEAADRIDESVKGDKAYIAYAYHDETVDGVYYTEWARGMNYIGVYTGVKAPRKKTDYEWSMFSPGVYVGGGEMPDYADIQIDPDSEDIDYVVVQETGDSEVSVMSQKATTEAINEASGNTQILANALKGTATGAAVRVDDVSPLPHEMAVKVRSKNLCDNVFEDGGINQDTGAHTTVTGNSRSANFIAITPNTVYTLSKCGTDKDVRFRFYDKGKNYIGYKQSAVAVGTLTKTFTSASDAYYVRFDMAQPYDEGFILQLEVGSTATEYTPYVDVSAVKVTAWVKNFFENDTDKIAAVTYIGSSGAAGTRHGYALRLPAGTYTGHARYKDDYQDSFIYGVVNTASGEYKCAGNLVQAKYQFDPTITIDEGDIWYIYDAHTGHTINGSREVFEHFDIQIELGSTVTAYEPYIAPTEYPVNADGTVDGVASVAPTTTLMTDTEGAVLDVEYNRDINKAFADLARVVDALVGG